MSPTGDLEFGGGF